MCDCVSPHCTGQTHVWRRTVLHEQLISYCENCSAAFVIDDPEVMLHEKT